MNTSNANSSYDNPMYYLEFSIHGTGAEIHLNGIPVHKQETPGTTDSQKPIPESIIDGKNILSIRTFPLKGEEKNKEDSYVEASININERNGPLNNSKTLLQLRLNPGLENDRLLDGTTKTLGNDDAQASIHSEKESIAERSIDIHSPYPRWAWQDGQIIDNTSENYKSLLSVYKEIYEALKAENKEKTYELYQPAAQEFAYAYNYSDPKEGHRIMNTGGFMNDPEWTLADMNKLLARSKFHLQIFANGKLANIVDDEFNLSPIFYIQKGSQNLAFQEFAFYKNKNGKWIMIR